MRTRGGARVRGGALSFGLNVQSASSRSSRVGFAGSVPAEQLRAKLNADILRFFADYVDADSIEQQD